MKKRTLVLGLLFLGRIHADAGDTKSEILEAKEPEDHWKFTLAMPGWIAGVSGDVGINGVVANVDVGADTIVRNIYGAATMQAEVSKGRLGFMGDFLYAGLGGSAASNGLVKNVDVKLEQMIGNLDVRWRLIDNPRGSLDALAGMRYVNLYQELTVRPQDDAIAQASANLVDEVGRRVRTRLSSLELRSLIRQRIQNRLGELENRRPELPMGPLGARERGPIGDRVEEIINERKAELAAAVRASIQAQTAARRAQARARVNTIKSNLTNRITRALETKLDQTFARRDFWFDPIIGLRGRYYLSDAWYLTAYGDVGGFGAGSDLTWQATGAVGCQVTKSIFAEVGYRALGINYRSNGLIYDVVMQGAQITAGITF